MRMMVICPWGGGCGGKVRVRTDTRSDKNQNRGVVRLHTQKDKQKKLVLRLVLYILTTLWNKKKTHRFELIVKDKLALTSRSYFKSP